MFASRLEPISCVLSLSESVPSQFRARHSRFRVQTHVFEHFRAPGPISEHFRVISTVTTRFRTTAHTFDLLLPFSSPIKCLYPPTLVFKHWNPFWRASDPQHSFQALQRVLQQITRILNHIWLLEPIFSASTHFSKVNTHFRQVLVIKGCFKPFSRVLSHRNTITSIPNPFRPPPLVFDGLPLIHNVYRPFSRPFTHF